MSSDQTVSRDQAPRTRTSKRDLILNTAHDLVNPTAGKCVTADSTGNGARLVLRSCADTINQKWHKA